PSTKLLTSGPKSATFHRAAALTAHSVAGKQPERDLKAVGCEKTFHEQVSSVAERLARREPWCGGLGNHARGHARCDALSIYFGDATLASAFVARWCLAAKVVTAGGVFQVREDEPEPRVGAGLHRTP